MAWNCSASSTGKNSIHTPGKPSDDWPRYLASPGTACYHPSLHRCSNVLFIAISLTSSSPQDLISLAWGEGGAGQCFWLLSFPAQGEKKHAKGSDTFPPPLPGSSRAEETKHGVQVDDATSKHESPAQAVIPRESAWQQRGPWCLHLLQAEGPEGAAPHPLPGAHPAQPTVHE